MKPHLVFAFCKWWVVIRPEGRNSYETLVYGRDTPRETIERWAEVNKRYKRLDE